MKVDWVRVGGAVIAVASFVAIGVAVDARIEQDRFISCQATVFDDLVSTLDDRTGPAERDRLALKQVFLDVANSTSREQTLAALNRYNAVVAASDLERQKLPLPEPVRTACDSDNL